MKSVYILKSVYSDGTGETVICAYYDNAKAEEDKQLLDEHGDQSKEYKVEAVKYNGQIKKG